jgi:transcription initiation factor IIE alpha subunit
VSVQINGTNQIEHLPPSAKLVWKVLETGGLLTQKEIIQKTYLPPRTVRYAINRLRGENVIMERFYFKDARQSLYGLRTAGVING